MHVNIISCPLYAIDLPLSVLISETTVGDTSSKANMKKTFMMKCTIPKGKDSYSSYLVIYIIDQEHATTICPDYTCTSGLVYPSSWEKEGQHKASYYHDYTIVHARAFYLLNSWGYPPQLVCV